jgi:hypothetical protein
VVTACFTCFTWGCLHLFRCYWSPCLSGVRLAVERVLLLWVDPMRGGGHFLSSLCKKTVEEVRSADFGGHLGRKPKPSNQSLPSSSPSLSCFPLLSPAPMQPPKIRSRSMMAGRSHARVAVLTRRLPFPSTRGGGTRDGGSARWRSEGSNYGGSRAAPIEGSNDGVSGFAAEPGLNDGGSRPTAERGLQ